MDRSVFKALVFYFFLILLIGYVGYVVSYPHSPYEGSVQWRAVPAVVKGTVYAHGRGGQPVEIKKIVKNDEVIYRVEVKTLDGKKLILKVEEGGDLLELRDQSKNQEDGEDDSTPHPHSPTK